MSVASVAVRLLARRVRTWSFATAARRGASLGRMAYRLDRRHRQVAIDNLRAAFPERNDTWRQAVALASFEQAGRTMVELLWSPNLSIAGAAEDVVSFEGLDTLKQITASGSGAIVATAHYGNWELMGIAAAREGLGFVSIARPLDDPALDRQLGELRSSTGQSILPKRRAMRTILRSLQDAKAVAIMSDQNTVRREAVFVPYFGHPAATTPAIAQLHIRTGAPILTAFAVPASGGYKIVIEPLENIPSEPTAADIETITAMVTARIEHYVRAVPEAWLWMHDRWRERPEA